MQIALEINVIPPLRADVFVVLHTAITIAYINLLVNSFDVARPATWPVCAQLKTHNWPIILALCSGKQIVNLSDTFNQCSKADIAKVNVEGTCVDNALRQLVATCVCSNLIMRGPQKSAQI